MAEYTMFACRACLGVAMEFVHLETPIADDTEFTLQEFYTSSTNLLVNKDDGLPYYLCMECTNELRKFYEFVQKARESELACRERMEAVRAATFAREEGKDNEFFGFDVDDGDVVVHDPDPNESSEVVMNFTFADDDDDEDVNSRTHISIERQEESDDEPDDSNEDYTQDPGDIRLDDFNYKELNETAAEEVPTRKYLCTQCKEKFPSKLQLAKHLSASHSEKEFLCRLCGLECFSHEMLSGHLFQHKDLKTYSCRECEMQHFTKFGFRIHMMTVHLSEQLHKCDICGKIFQKLLALENHKFTHLGEERKYPCNLCEKRFVEEIHLQHHLMVHNGEEPYLRFNARIGRKHVCPICSKVCGRPSDLRKHMFDHEGRKPYECPDCPKGFKRKYRYRAHLEEMHKKTLDNNSKVVFMD